MCSVVQCLCGQSFGVVAMSYLALRSSQLFFIISPDEGGISRMVSLSPLGWFRIRHECEGLSRTLRGGLSESVTAHSDWSGRLGTLYVCRVGVS